MLKSSLLRRTLPAWLLLVAGLLATVFASLQIKQGVEQEAVKEFAFVCDQVGLKIQERLGAYALILRGGAGLFAASHEVERDEWRAYVETLRAEGSVPGVQGIGFAKVIAANELASHIARIRAQGFPDYVVNPPGERPLYTSIIYLEPFRDRNLRAFGYDMFSEPVRRSAMEQARDSGEAALSGKVALVQETGTDVQAGTLMYVPVYRNDLPRDTLTQRRAALTGWAYSPYRMNDLMAGILRDWGSREGKAVDLHIFDGLQATPATLLFDSNAANVPDLHSKFHLRRTIAFNGRQWLLEFDHTAKSSSVSYTNAWASLTGGLALSGLLFGLMLSMINTRASARRIAGELTEEISGREKVAQAASQYARSLIEASLDPLVTISPAGKITDVNQATEKITGRGRLELIGTDFCDYFTEPDRARTGYLHVFAEGFVTDYPLALRRRDGHVTDVLYNASVYRNEAGEVLGVFAAARDVTDRKKAEAELRESEAMLQATMKILPVGLWVLDAKGNIVFGNDAAQRIWGGVRYVGIEQLGQYKGWRLDGGKPIEAHEWAGARAVQKGETAIEEEAEIECFDGTHRIILDSAVPLRSGDGSIRGAVTVNQDITQRKRAELEREQYFKFFNAATDLMGIADPNGAFKKINPAFPKTLGYSEAELLGKPFMEFVHPDDRQATRDEMARQLQCGFTLNFENRYLCKDGSLRWLSWIANVKYDEGLTYATARDITELKAAEAKIKELNRDLERRVEERTGQLEAANKELEAFSYSVSHDLRTPLRAIDGFSHILLEDYTDKLDAEGKRLLGVVRDNTLRMGKLIDDILKFSRAGRLEISYGQIDMESLAREVSEELGAATGSRLQVEIGHLPPALGDRAMMRQVWVNLLSNAIKFSRTREFARIEVGSSVGESEIVYFVKDNGVGFDMQYADKLFGVFQRLHAQTEFEGTGIGLAIVKRIVSRHGGRAWAEGKVDAGATLYFALPIRPVAQE